MKMGTFPVSPKMLFGVVSGTEGRNETPSYHVATRPNLPMEACW